MPTGDGTSRSSSASRLPMIVSPSTSRPGTGRGRAPVAMMTFAAVKLRSPPFTSIVFASDRRAAAVHVLHLVLSQQHPDARGESPDHAAAAVDRLAEVVLEVVDGDAELLGPVEQAEHLRVLEQRFAGNAAPVEADAAQLRLLNQRRPQAQLARAYGCHVAAGPAADYRHVKVIVRHASHPCERVPAMGRLQYTPALHRRSCGSRNPSPGGAGEVQLPAQMVRQAHHERGELWPAITSAHPRIGVRGRL